MIFGGFSSILSIEPSLVIDDGNCSPSAFNHVSVLFLSSQLFKISIVFPTKKRLQLTVACGLGYLELLAQTKRDHRLMVVYVDINGILVYNEDFSLCHM